jgi:hypothetical protein
MSRRNTLRRVFMAAVALAALPVIAQAQTSRVEGMALPGDYIKDYTGIYTYTSGVVNVGNLVYGELGNVLSNPNTGHPQTLDRGVGAVLQNLFDGKLGTWAVHLREETPSLGQGDNFSQPNLGAAGGDPNENRNESFDIMWGRKFGTTSLGLRLNRSYFRSKTEPLAGVTTDFRFDPTAGASPNLSRNLWGLGGGLGFEMNANTNVEVSLLYQNRKFEADSVAGTKLKDDGPSTYMVSVRAMYQWEPNVMLVPVFKYYSFDLSEREAGAAATSNTLKGWQAGVAGNWTVGNNDLFVLGVAFAQNRIEQDEAVFAAPAPVSGKATETIAPQIFSALETHVNNWLTLRFGASKGAYNKVKIEPTGGGNTEVTSSPFAMNIGSGVKLGTLQLDAVLNTIFPQTLGWLGSGISTVYFPKVTATYSF